MNVHHRDQCAMLKGEKTIRKRPNDSPTNPNLQKVNRTKVPPKRKFIQYPHGRGKPGQKPKAKQHRPTPHSKMKTSNWQHKNKKHSRTVRTQTTTLARTPLYRKSRRTRNQEEAAEKPKSPKNTVTAKPSQRRTTLRDLSKVPQEKASPEPPTTNPQLQCRTVTRQN